MRLRFLIVIALAGSLLVVLTTAAGAARQARLDIPACEELLTVAEAKAAMGEPVAFILNREVRDATRVCAYGGGSPAGVTHGVGLNWGPYADVRKRAAVVRKPLCSESKTACKRFDAAMSLRRNEASFLVLDGALEQVGVTRALPAAAFDGSRAFVWRPGANLPDTFSQLAWVFVYYAKSASLLQVLCTDIGAKAPDTACAIAAAKRAFDNITS